MKKFPFFIFAIVGLFFACKKEPGEGGRASIKGKVKMIDTIGGNQGEYFLPNEDVFIIYGEEDDIYDDDTKTNYDGSFQFKNLRKGTYRVFVYTNDASSPSGISPVIKSVEISSNKEMVEVETIVVYK
ncbi:MAG: hypothetical protein Kow0079_07790 [Vicingaceae bacterium]